MGFYFSKAWTKIIGMRDTRLLILGLDGAGKTTILYKFKLNETVKTMPTIGFNVESIEFKGLNMSVWDVGGQTKIRALWKHYYQNTDGLIFVVDSNDIERVKEAEEELKLMLNEEELKDTVLLVMANKQDMKGSLTPNEIADSLGLTMLKGRQWMVQGTCGNSGQGLNEGLDWMAKCLLKKK